MLQAPKPPTVLIPHPRLTIWVQQLWVGLRLGIQKVKLAAPTKLRELRRTSPLTRSPRWLAVSQEKPQSGALSAVGVLFVKDYNERITNTATEWAQDMCPPVCIYPIHCWKSGCTYNLCCTLTETCRPVSTWTICGHAYLSNGTFGQVITILYACIFLETFKIIIITIMA